MDHTRPVLSESSECSSPDRDGRVATLHLIHASDHGVPKVRPGTGDPASGLTSGRLNLTLRVTGLTD